MGESVTESVPLVSLYMTVLPMLNAYAGRLIWLSGVLRHIVVQSVHVFQDIGHDVWISCKVASFSWPSLNVSLTTPRK
jgi:hypothetical protein